MASHPDLPTPVMRDETRQKLGLMTPDELSLTLEVTTTTLQTWRCEGKGPRYIKLGKGVFYRLTDVKDWIDEQADETESVLEETTKEEPDASQYEPNGQPA